MAIWCTNAFKCCLINMSESNRLWLGTKCRAAPLCRCLSDCLWGLCYSKTRQWKWSYPLQFPHWEISLGSRETDGYTQIGIISRCFSCQKNFSYNLTWQCFNQTPQPSSNISRAKANDSTCLWPIAWQWYIMAENLPSRTLCQQASTQLTMPAEEFSMVDHWLCFLEQEISLPTEDSIWSTWLLCCLLKLRNPLNLCTRCAWTLNTSGLT